MNNLDKIIELLYIKNFYNDKLDNSYSSHWSNYTKRLFVKKKNNNLFEIRSFGIANFTHKNLFSIVKSIPRKFYLLYLFFKFVKDVKIFQDIKFISHKTNILIEFDQIKHGIILKLLKKNIIFNNDKYICIIGDGHGFCGSLIKKHYPSSKVIFINLGRNLFLDAYYLNKSFKNSSSLLLNNKNIKDINNQEFIFLDSANCDLISKLPIFLFINIASMQEMDNKTISNYFKYMRKNPHSEYFYCCNRIHKILPDSSDIIFDKYPWITSDKILVEEICNWYKKYPISRYPFLKRFDGLIKHKLIKFSNSHDK